MITDFDDLCLWTYVIVDDILIELAPLLQRPGPRACSRYCPDLFNGHLIYRRSIINQIRTWPHNRFTMSGIGSFSAINCIC